MDIKTANNYIENLQFFGIKLGLEQVRELFERADIDCSRLKFIHIAGSNGKGSTGAMIMSGLREAGVKTGFYTSPHLITVRERFRVNGKAVSATGFISALSALKPHIETMKKAGRCPTYFEVTTALAALIFIRSDVEFAIWETGMGGRFDATNIVNPECSVITGISSEHSGYLGDTVEKIAFEKAGIIKSGIPVFCGGMSTSCREVFIEEAEKRSSSVTFVDKTLDPPKNMKGHFQGFNAALAYKALTFICSKYGFSEEKALEGLSHARWPGRMETLADGTIIDGAHNSDGVSALNRHISSSTRKKKFTVIFGCFADKDYPDMLKELGKTATEFIFVPISSTRKYVPPEKLKDTAMKLRGISSCRTANSLKEALREASFQNKIITGSLYLAGEALKLLGNKEEILNI
jgi:dihydrofolate synthase/folylpolyglutamate synthase